MAPTAIETISPNGLVFVSGQFSNIYEQFNYLFPSGPVTFVSLQPSNYAGVVAANAAGQFVAESQQNSLYPSVFEYSNGVYSLITQLSTPTGIGLQGQVLGTIYRDGHQTEPSMRMVSLSKLTSPALSAALQRPQD